MKFFAMVAAIVIALSLFLAFIRGGQLNRLKNVDLRLPYLAIISFILDFLPYHLNHIPSWVLFIIFIVKYTLLLIFIFFNSKYKHIKIIGMGILMNFLVILLNGGAMPVSRRALEIPSLAKQVEMIQSGVLSNYTLMTDKTPLWILADIIYIPWPKEQFISIGDITIMLGIFLFIQDIMLTE
jgi:signal transduction histidine kinase